MIEYSDLDQYRQKGDAVGDYIVSKINWENPQTFYSRLRKIHFNKDLYRLSDFLEIKVDHESCSKLPHWIDKKLVKKAQAFFSAHNQEIMQVLGLYSLPYCYACADGAKVLYLSEKIRDNPAKRLMDTGRFVFEIFQPDGFASWNKSLVSIFKIRILHAKIRYFTLRNPYWNCDNWGIPINQEDMAGTNLAFSHLLLKGLKKVGLRITEDDEKAYIHFWNIVSYFQGVSDELLPQDIHDAKDLSKAISDRQILESDEGIKLTHSLIQHIENAVPLIIRPYVKSQMRFLLGDELSDILHIHATTKKLPPYVNVISRILNPSQDYFGSKSKFMVSTQKIS